MQKKNVEVANCRRFMRVLLLHSNFCILTSFAKSVGFRIGF